MMQITIVCIQVDKFHFLLAEYWIFFNREEELYYRDVFGHLRNWASGPRGEANPNQREAFGNRIREHWVELVASVGGIKIDHALQQVGRRFYPICGEVVKTRIVPEVYVRKYHTISLSEIILQVKALPQLQWWDIVNYSHSNNLLIVRLVISNLLGWEIFW